jgi:hypothetical protein
VLNGDNSVAFTPAADSNGPTEFDDTLGDGSLTDAGHVTVTVTAVNDAPIVTKGANKTGVDNDTGQVSASFEAPNKDNDRKPFETALASTSPLKCAKVGVPRAAPAAHSDIHDIGKPYRHPRPITSARPECSHWLP